MKSFSQLVSQSFGFSLGNKRTTKSTLKIETNNLID
jgi:hypothetical protein